MFPGLGAVIGATIVVMVVLGAAAVLVPVALAYVALRVQDAKQSTPDPKLGMKLAFHAVHTTAIFIILAGLSIFMIDLMEGAIAPAPNVPNFGGRPGQVQQGGMNAEQRTAIAMVGSGALFAVVFWAFLMGTNDSELRSVRRVFGGGRMALCLLITMFTVTGLIINLAQKSPEHQITEALIGMLLVWLPAGIIFMVLFFANVNARTTAYSRRRDDDEDDRPWRPPGR
jgi:heme/copper-type cytochrome/quinol oxidase subunit 2